MKRALQAILIFGTKMKEDVLYGRKKITIREGHRDYINGPVLIGCGVLNWATMKTITNVVYTTLDQVTNEERRDGGFGAKINLLIELKKFYPKLTTHSPVTVVRWE